MTSKDILQYSLPSIVQMYCNLKVCHLSKNGKGKLNQKYFYWEFDLQSNSLSQVYRVLIIYHIDNYTPDVFILNEEVWEISKTKEIPHLYDFEKIRLCLYYPSFREWTQYMDLCTTFISWIALWLYFYEEWLYSGEWKGGGKHPEPIHDEVEQKEIINTVKKVKKRKRTKYEKATIKINKIYKNRKNSYLKKVSENK